MPDRTDELLDSFARAPVAPGSAAAARARGDQRRRRAGATSALAAVATVVAVVSVLTAHGQRDDDSTPPVTSKSQTSSGPSTTPASTSPTTTEEDPAARFWLTTAPASELIGRGDVPELDLTRGIVDMSGDGGEVAGPAADLQGVDRTLACGKTVLDQSLPMTGRLVATGSGPEYGEVHQVVSYPDAGTALAQMTYLRDLISGCPRVAGDVSTLGWSAMLFVPTTADTGYDTSTFGQYLEGAPGVGTWQVTRVGRAVLFVTTAGEISQAGLTTDAEQLTRTTHQLAPLLCGFTDAGC
jgi:hypothetical protein